MQSISAEDYAVLRESAYLLRSLVFEDHGWDDYTSRPKTDRKMLARQTLAAQVPLARSLVSADRR